MKCITNTSQGDLTISNNAMGKGGEGSVYSVTSHSIRGLSSASELVAKIYHSPKDGDRENKIKAMLASPPDSTAVAWPLGIVYDDSNSFVGYVMVKLPMDLYKSWAELSHVSDRRKGSPDFDVQYAMTASRNLAAAIDSIHNAGHIVGDVNESNILISSDAQVMIVDTDSAQISTRDGKIFPCLVGKPEYTAPEISHGSLRSHKRTIATDVFAYCVTTFMMLTGGAHPSSAVYTGSGDPPKTIDKIRQGIYPGIVDVPSEFKPVPRIPVNALPKVFKNIFAKGLSIDPSKRPSLKGILKAEDVVLSNATRCSKQKLHWYDKREGSCPWCKHAKNNIDPWSPENSALKDAIKSSNVEQKSLPGVQFNNRSKEPVVAKRKPVVTGGSTPASAINPAQQGPSPSSQRPPSTQPTTGYPTPTNGNVGNAPQKRKNKPQGLYEPPEKQKGKVVLSNGLGKVQRPPLSALFKQSPKLATFAFMHEIPDFIKPWWPKYRPFPSGIGILLGAIIGACISFSWAFLVPLAIASTGALKYPIVEQAMPYATLSSIYLSLAFLVFFLVSSIQKLRQKKNYNHLKPYGLFRTMIYFVAVSAFYGLGFVLIFASTVVILALGKILDALTKPQR